MVFVVIIAVILIILLGVLYFIKQKDLGEDTPGSVIEKRGQSRKSLAEIIKFTSAPEKNPDIKPNPDLTILISAPNNIVSTKTDFEFMDNLTAPKN